MKEIRFSTRVSQIQPSGIRRIFDIACANPDGIDLSIGDPDFDIPEPIKDEGVHWIKSGFNHYVSTRGVPELREKVSMHLKICKSFLTRYMTNLSITSSHL